MQVPARAFPRPGGVVVLLLFAGLGLAGPTAAAPPAPEPMGPGHTRSILCVAVSPEGRQVATGSDHPDCAVVLWNLGGGPPVHRFTGHPNALTTLAFSPDGRLLATASGLFEGRSHLIVWDVASRTVAWRADTGVNTLDALAFSPDGRTLAGSGANRTIEQWDATTGRSGATLAIRFSNAPARDLRFCPDGERLALVAGEAAWIVDRTTGRALRSLRHGTVARGVAVSPDGARAVVVGGPTVRIWDLSSGAELGAFETAHDNLDVAFSPDGRSVAMADRVNGAVVWDVTLRTETHRFVVDGWSAGIPQLVFSPDGRTLAAAARLHPVLWSLGPLSADNEDDEEDDRAGQGGPVQEP